MSTTLTPGPPYPAAFHVGAGHMIVHGNRAFIEAFGAGLHRPAGARGAARPAAGRVRADGPRLSRRQATGLPDHDPDGERRLVVAARRDPETGETYGVTTHLRPVARETGSAT